MARVTQILVIEDDDAIRDLFREVLRDEGYELFFVDALEEAAGDSAPDLIITDLVGLDRYDSRVARASVRRVEERYPGSPIIVCTAYEQAVEELDQLGAAAVLLKPFTIQELVRIVVQLAAP